MQKAIFDGTLDGAHPYPAGMTSFDITMDRVYCFNSLTFVSSAIQSFTLQVGTTNIKTGMFFFFFFYPFDSLVLATIEAQRVLFQNVFFPTTCARTWKFVSLTLSGTNLGEIVFARYTPVVAYYGDNSPFVAKPMTSLFSPTPSVTLVSSLVSFVTGTAFYAGKSSNYYQISSTSHLSTNNKISVLFFFFESFFFELTREQTVVFWHLWYPIGATVLFMFIRRLLALP